MSIKDLLAVVISLDEDESALGVQADLAERFAAHGAVLIVAVHPASSYAEEPATLSEVVVDIAEGGLAAARERAGIVAWLKNRAPAFEPRDVLVVNAAREKAAVAHARFADLTILTRASPHSRARRAILESILFHAGRPVLLVPDTWARAAPGQNILIGWKPTREAVRAVKDAMPFLKAARAVTVATVDARPSATGYGDVPGHDLAAHLSRHGVQVEVRHVDGLGRSEGKALSDEAVAIGADMLVMGAYGRSRAEERLLGGVTRELLDAAPVPLLLAH